MVARVKFFPHWMRSTAQMFAKLCRKATFMFVLERDCSDGLPRSEFPFR